MGAEGGTKNLGILGPFFGSRSKRATLTKKGGLLGGGANFFAIPQGGRGKKNFQNGGGFLFSGGPPFLFYFLFKFFFFFGFVYHSREFFLCGPVTFIFFSQKGFFSFRGKGFFKGDAFRGLPFFKIFFLSHFKNHVFSLFRVFFFFFGAFLVVFLLSCRV